MHSGYYYDYFSLNFRKTNHTQSFIDLNNTLIQHQFLLSKKGKLITCSDDTVLCVILSITIDDLQANGESIQLELDLEIEPNYLIQIMPDDVEKVSLYYSFAFHTDLPQEVFVTTIGSLVLYRTITVVSVWLYVTATVIGLIISALITYVLYRVGICTHGLRHMLLSAELNYNVHFSINFSDE